ncbi:MAG: hypothetical protein C4519_22235 [Desulfobacteraceae bacterium]|nr:MAG: hypothetical protein C4519_22235 [Desulfobacteraceae bacterium]
MGFELIAANNGWAMAVTGAAIVVLGLTALAAIISQLHKIVFLFEKKAAEPSAPAITSPEAHEFSAATDLLNDLSAAAHIIKGVSVDLGDRFELTALYRLLGNEQVPHPHLTIRSLREAGFLVPVEKGTFTWQNV